MSIERFVALWDLVPDGTAWRTRSSDLLPVFCGGTAAMLKVPREDEERLGARLMHWWNGDGAARVLAHDEASGALVLERATGPGDLAAMVLSGRDDEATTILSKAVLTLHAPRDRLLPPLVPLDRWFEALPLAAQRCGGIYAEALEVARRLLASPRDIVALHGDVHHGNLLDFGPHGWLAIDPKGLVGERTFDYGNMLRNPDPATAPTRDRFAGQVRLVSQIAGLERRRLLEWTFAFAGLSAAWCAEAREDAAEGLADRAVMDLARAELRSSFSG